MTTVSAAGTREVWQPFTYAGEASAEPLRTALTNAPDAGIATLIATHDADTPALLAVADLAHVEFATARPSRRAIIRAVVAAVRA